MKCFEIEKLLDQFVGDELDFAVRQKVSEHLNECADCQSAAEKLQNTADLLKNLPLIAPSNQLDARMMQAFRKHQETQNQPSFWKAFFSRFSISKPALACAALLMIVFTALAFQLGKMSAPANEIANSKNAEAATRIVQIVEKRVEIPVIKTVEVPVYKEKFVTRVFYRTREVLKTQRVLIPTENTFRNSSNTAITYMPIDDRTFIPTNLKNFQPISEIKVRIKKRGGENEY